MSQNAGMWRRFYAGGVPFLENDESSERRAATPPAHHQRCPECRGRKMLPGMVRTDGQGMGSKYGPCPTCDGLGYLPDEVEE